MSADDRTADILVVASVAPDLAGMRTWLGERLAGSIGNLRVTAKIVGVGLAVAGTSTARGIIAVRPRAVVHIGACGVYPGLAQYRPHDVLVPTSVRVVDHAVLAVKSAFPDPMQTTMAYHQLMGTALESCGPRVFRPAIASTLATTVDDTLAAAVHPSTQCDAESLEAFAIAAACRAADVPCAAVLGVTNIVGSTGRHDWGQFHREAVTAAAVAFSTWLHNGALGLPH